MRLLVVGVLFSAVGIVAADSPLDLFDFEKIQLSEDTFQGEALSFFRSHLAPQDGVAPVTWANRTCKTFPGDAKWPSEDTWSRLNGSLNGVLLKPAPVASVCFNQTAFSNYDADKCKAVSASWSTSFVR